ncbi:hypothetical protein GCM10007978_06630 [Shewanella hanedai]|uniref:Glycosyltransferase n=1 Tax=Shewanella hanedai TaxID=25 RepID=A0A553JTB8_SHEHA|nr:glycosyltransferase [Shewanella hanedai]TRY15689.1 glycosyltransferase [Shewanella hanedai]GGI71353.1 hypothetical protein GCM10007978_06630 [Shewanella hanedai]
MVGMVSIIVPIFNSELYLKKCIDSILDQKYSNLELILVNDGSQDGSLEICNYYKNIDRRVKVIDKVNEGVAAARNDGLDVATGKYIGFVDSDDVVCDDLYEKLVILLNNSAADCAALSSYKVNEKKGRIFENGQVITSTQALNCLLELKFPTSLWAYLYKSELISDIRLNRDIHFFEDFDFNARVLMKSDFIAVSTENLYFYRQNSTSINAQGVNVKRLTCMDIPDLVYGYLIMSNKKELIKKVKYLDSYFIISALAPLKLPFSENEIKYSKAIVFQARKVFPGLIFSNYVPLKFKIYVFLVSLNINIALRIRDSL